MSKTVKNSKLLVALALGAVLVGCQSQPTEEALDAAAEMINTDVVDSGTHSMTGMDDATSVDSSEEMRSDELDAAEALRAFTVFYFDFDMASIKPESYKILQAHATFLAESSASSIRLEGHADERGTREYNIALGERRAKAVEKFLLINGVSAAQIETVSYGEERPVSMEHNASAWTQNRRVKLSYQ